MQQQNCVGLVNPRELKVAARIDSPIGASLSIGLFQDLLTRWVEVKIIRTATAKNVAAAFEELVLFRWEAPDILMSDNGKYFGSDLFRDALLDYVDTHVTTPPYHPQVNPVDRVNNVFKTMIATYVG